MMAAIANDHTKEVLIFKQSAGTGFDAPRAFVLASTKLVNDADFAMQFIGRVMRVAPQVRDAFPKPQEIPDALDTAYVYLADGEAQAGFQEYDDEQGHEPQLADQPPAPGEPRTAGRPAGQARLILSWLTGPAAGRSAPNPAGGSCSTGLRRARAAC